MRAFGERGIGVGGTHSQIRQSPVAPPNHLPLLAPGSGDPTIPVRFGPARRSVSHSLVIG
jgi:hypothetical protein